MRATLDEVLLSMLSTLMSNGWNQLQLGSHSCAVPCGAQVSRRFLPALSLLTKALEFVLVVSNL